MMRFIDPFIFTGAFLITSPKVLAQSFSSPPEFQQVDKNGVDLLSGTASLSIKLGSIGSGIGELSYYNYWSSGPQKDNLTNKLYYYYYERQDKYSATTVFENSAKTFAEISRGSDTWRALRGPGSSLVRAADGTYRWTIKTGEVRTYAAPPVATGDFILKTRSLPNGVIWTYDWQQDNGFTRPVSLSNNLGYKITLSYQSNSTPSYSNMTNLSAWYFVTSASFWNIASSLSPIFSASRSGTQITTASGEVWNVSGNSYASNPPSNVPFNVKTPSSASTNYTYMPKTILNNGSLSTTTLTVNGLTYRYDYSLSGTAGITTVTNPDNSSVEVKYIKYESPLSSAAFPTSSKDELSRSTIYESNGSYLVSSLTQPDSNKYLFEYSGPDVKKLTHQPKPSSNLPALVEEATYPSPCSNAILCSLPTSFKDANLGVTSYEYAPEHGGLLKEIRPAGANGVQPVKRYRYAQRYAWFLSGSGGYIKASTPVWLKTEERTCRTTATVGDACQGGSTDEIVTAYDYGPDAGPNNLLLRGVAVLADGATRRTCYSYDARGNRISETRPRAGLASCP